MTQVATLTWDEVERRIGLGALAVLPVGAGAKQHAFHLPMNADAIQAEAMATHVATTVDALIWPTVTYGHYPAFATYAGSASLSPRLFEDLVHEIAAALLGYGARGLVLVDTGISTNAPIARALRRLADPGRTLHLRVYEGSRFCQAETCATQPHGQHADEIETSIVLALAPGTVDMARAVAGFEAPPGPGPMQHHDPAAPNFSASGAIGDPTRASRELGEALVAAMAEDLTASVREWAAKLPPPHAGQA